jgi:S-adenosylmethionine:tRNA ribosyltransferase-isomerase
MSALERGRGSASGATGDVERAAELLAEYHYELPDELIAQAPAERREAARMMLVERHGGAVVGEARAGDLDRLLAPGDLLVVNATRVLPARLRGTKSSGGRCEALLLDAAPRFVADDPRPRWRALVRSSGRLREGLTFSFGAPEAPARAELVSLGEGGIVELAFAGGGDPFVHGEAPLPPYIRRPLDASDAATRTRDLERYQTVYAREPGAVAAPTAGLHLTDALLSRLRERGIGCEEVVLHVGIGTFRPLRPEDVEAGRLHAEPYSLPEKTADAIARTRAGGGRVVAVGTTTTRVLEHCADGAGGVRPGRGETDLFLRPGAPIRVVDGLLTNLHLPGSSLLMLVAAFIGYAPMRAAYARAVAERYRFFSYGDAMLILPGLGAR